MLIHLNNSYLYIEIIHYTLEAFSTIILYFNRMESSNMHTMVDISKVRLHNHPIYAFVSGYSKRMILLA